jgi:hypothetical protein
MSEHSSESTAAIDFQFSWEGPAEHAPGVLFDLPNPMMPFDVALPDLANWIAVAAMSGVVGNLATDAIKAKVRALVAAWRQLHGQAKTEQLKQHVTKEMMNHRANGKLSEEELRQRIDAFFKGIQG